MKFLRRHWRKFLVPVLVAAVVSIALGAVAASKASAQTAQPSISIQHQQELQKRCTHNTPLDAHSRYSAEAHLIATCTHYYRVYADWQQVGFKFGPSKKSGYSAVCAHSGCSGSGGTLFEAGVERMSDHHMFCEYSCASAVLAKMSAQMALSQRRTTYIDIHNSSCLKEQVYAWQTLNGNKTHAEWRTGYNGCLWWIRLHVHCGIPTRGIDKGWFYSGWIVSYPPVATEVVCPDNTFGFHVYLQWKHHVSNTIYHRKLK